MKLWSRRYTKYISCYLAVSMKNGFKWPGILQRTFLNKSDYDMFVKGKDSGSLIFPVRPAPYIVYTSSPFHDKRYTEI